MTGRVITCPVACEYQNRLNVWPLWSPTAHPTHSSSGSLSSVLCWVGSSSTNWSPGVNVAITDSSAPSNSNLKPPKKWRLYQEIEWGKFKRWFKFASKIFAVNFQVDRWSSHYKKSWNCNVFLVMLGNMTKLWSVGLFTCKNLRQQGDFLCWWHLCNMILGFTLKYLLWYKFTGVVVLQQQ